MSSQSGNVKIPYEKPVIKTIELAAEEVLGIGCKIGSSPSGVPEIAVCAVSVCDQEGS
jgi:hypothetical protein